MSSPKPAWDWGPSETLSVGGRFSVMVRLRLAWGISWEAKGTVPLFQKSWKISCLSSHCKSQNPSWSIFSQPFECICVVFGHIFPLQVLYSRQLRNVNWSCATDVHHLLGTVAMLQSSQQDGQGPPVAGNRVILPGFACLGTAFLSIP